MATYLVRIELRGKPSSAAYDDLHREMEAAGFRRWVELANGRFKLPTAEYLTEENSGLQDAVRDRADDAANSAWQDHETLVVEVYGNNICSYELQSWREPNR